MNLAKLTLLPLETFRYARCLDGSAGGSGACAGAGAVLPEGDTCSSSLSRSHLPPAARVGELSSSSSTNTEAVAPHLGPNNGEGGWENWVTDLASQLQLDAPASAHPLTVTTGANSSSAHAALAGLLEPTLHQAPGLQQGVEHAALQRAGLQRAGRLSALRLPGMPPEQQDPAHGLSTGRSDHVYSPSDMKALVACLGGPETWANHLRGSANHLREVARGPAAGISPHCSHRSDLEEDAEMEDAEMELDDREPDDFEPEGRNVIKRVWTLEEDPNPHPNSYPHPSRVTCSAAHVESEARLGRHRRQPAAGRAVGGGLRTAGRFFRPLPPRFGLAAHAAAREVQVRLAVGRRPCEHRQR